MDTSNSRLLSTFAICCMLIVLSACSSRSTSRTVVSATSTSTAPSNAFRFSDWRVAYLATNNYIHAVSFDGKSDAASAFPLPFSDDSIINGYISPDGHIYAYNETGYLFIYDLTRGKIPITGDRVNAAQALFWSTDGAYLAAGDYETNLWFVNMETHTSTHIPYTPPSDERDFPLGWVDAHHLAILRGGATGNYTFSSIDIVTGLEQVIATIPIADISGNLNWSLSPDGSLILLNNQPFRNNPYTPVVLTINTHTGVITHLPHIAQLTDSMFSTIAWRTGDPQTVAVAHDWISNGANQVWMLHVQTDTATQFTANNYPTAWSPDGKTLILSTGWYGEAPGSDPYTLTAMTFDASDKIVSQTALTNGAYILPFVGFAKTA